MGKTIHGNHTRSMTTPEYRSWAHAKGRCCNPVDKSYQWYGGRGISMCSRWAESFSAFLEDMGTRPTVRHTLERKDGSLGYQPGNCVWATMSQQNNNRRSNKIITVNGQSKNVKQWAESVGISRKTLLARINRGASPEMALSVGDLRRKSCLSGL